MGERRTRGLRAPVPRVRVLLFPSGSLSIPRERKRGHEKKAGLRWGGNRIHETRFHTAVRFSEREEQKTSGPKQVVVSGSPCLDQNSVGVGSAGSEHFFPTHFGLGFSSFSAPLTSTPPSSLPLHRRRAPVASTGTDSAKFTVPPRASTTRPATVSSFKFASINPSGAVVISLSKLLANKYNPLFFPKTNNI